MLNRKYNLKLDLQFRCNNSNMEFNQFDKNTSDFFIQINRSGKEVDLSKALVTLMVIKPNGNVDSQFLEIEGSEVYANLKPSLKDIPGDYQCKAIITIKDETVIPDQVFTYTVNEDKFLTAFNSSMATDEDCSLLTDMLSRLSTIETDEQQRQINEAERILSEEARKASENNRVESELGREHNDADREKAEAARNTNEFNRKTSESSRVEAESNRVKAENSRVEAENLRVEAEKLRSDNYDFMTSDEERRRSEENSRIEAENLRKQAETTRVNEESKRRTTEKARVLSENDRESKELERNSNENARKSNETKRVQAETERTDRYNNFITDAENAANNFKAYTSTAKYEEESRKGNEITRVEAEDRRISNEGKRVFDENTRKANEIKRVEAEKVRQSQFDVKVVEVNSKVQEVNTAKNTMVSDTKKAIDKMTNDFNSLSAGQQQDAEVILARDGEESLNVRLERDLFIGDKSLKQEVIDLGGLKESQDMAYATDKGYLICKETKNGTVKDLKISGKSLVNLLDSKLAASSTDRIKLPFRDVGDNKEITFVNFSDKAISVDINNRDTDTYKRFLVINPNSLKLISIGVNEKISLVSGMFMNGWLSSDIEKFKTSAIAIEGDHTQNPPKEYFEGIVSVGTGVNKIEVSSVNGGGNLFNIENPGYSKGDKSWAVQGTKIYVDDITRPYQSEVFYYARIEKGSSYTFSVEDLNCGIALYHGIVKSHTQSNYIEIITSENKEVRFTAKENFVTIKISNEEYTGNLYADKIMLNKGFKKTYHPYVKDKKAILFKDIDGNWKSVKELRGLNAVCDTIELHDDGKCYCHIRTEVKAYSSGDENNLEVMTDKVNTISKLKDEKVFEVNPLFLEAFEGETVISVSSGVISAPMEFKLTSSLPNLTRNLQLRIDNLENEIYKSQELQNIMLLESDLRIMDLEFALMESTPMKLNLRSDVMFTKGVTEFEFLKGRILSGSHTDEYLEKCINKYKKAGRLTNEEYDILYDMIYPPVYDVLAEK